MYAYVDFMVAVGFKREGKPSHASSDMRADMLVLWCMAKISQVLGHEAGVARFGCEAKGRFEVKFMCRACQQQGIIRASGFCTEW